MLGYMNVSQKESCPSEETSQETNFLNDADVLVVIVNQKYDNGILDQDRNGFAIDRECESQVT